MEALVDLTELDELEKKFAIWRKNKTSHREKIPDEYWSTAVELVNNSISPKVISERLRINPTDLKRHVRRAAKNELGPRRRHKITFKKFDLPMVSSPLFEITTASGVNLKVFQ